SAPPAAERANDHVFGHQVQPCRHACSARVIPRSIGMPEQINAFLTLIHDRASSSTSPSGKGGPCTWVGPTVERPRAPGPSPSGPRRQSSRRPARGRAETRNATGISGERRILVRLLTPSVELLLLIKNMFNLANQLASDVVVEIEQVVMSLHGVGREVES